LRGRSTGSIRKSALAGNLPDQVFGNCHFTKNAKMPFLTANITAMLLYQIEKKWPKNFLHERLLGRKPSAENHFGRNTFDETHFGRKNNSIC